MSHSGLFRYLILVLLLAGTSQLATVFGQDAVALPTIKPPVFEGQTKTVPLPAPLKDVKVGGGGRYLIFHLASLRKLAIFDVNEGKITGFIPTIDDSTRYDAGATKLVMVGTDSGVIVRWDLETQTKELTQTVDLGGPVGHVVLGSASAGPALVASGSSHSSKAFNVDLNSLQFSPFQMQGRGSRTFSSRANVRVSADGNVFAIWESGVSPSGLQSYVREGDVWKAYYEHDSVGHIVPSPNGRMLYTAAGVFTNQVVQVGATSGGRPQFGSMYCIPAVHGPYALRLNGGADPRHSKPMPESVSLMIEGDMRPLATIPGLEPVYSKSDDRYGRDGLSLDKRLFLIPDAKLVVQVSSDKSKLILTKFDVVSALRSSKTEFLNVSSRPPLSIDSGGNLKYQIDVLSSAEGVTYSLESGPPDMKLSTTGLLTWKTSSRSPSENAIIVSISNSAGQQTFHTFKLKVIGGSKNASIAYSASAYSASAKSGDPVRRIATKSADLNSDVQKLPMPGVVDSITVGGGGRFLFCHLRTLKKIAVVDVSEAKIVKFLPATDDSTMIAAGATRALVFNVEQGVVSRYRLDTMERELTTTIPFPHKVQYAAMGCDSEGPVALRTTVGTGALDSCNFQFLDVDSMQPIQVSWPNGHQPHASYRDSNFIRVSANGSVYCITGVGCYRFEGDRLEFMSSDPRFSHSRSAFLPFASGEHFLAQGRVYNGSLQPMGDNGSQYGDAVPSVLGSYFIGVSGSTNQRRSSGSGASKRLGGKLYMVGDSRPLVTIPELLHPSTTPTYGVRQMLSSRLFFIPQANVIAVLSATQDAIELHKFDLDVALEASGVDYLLVASRAPAKAELGEVYRYRLTVKSKRGGVQYNLESGPEKMAISNEGELTWRVPSRLAETKHTVIVSVSDKSGQSTFHNFTIETPNVSAIARIERETAERIAKQTRDAQASRKRAEDAEIAEYDRIMNAVQQQKKTTPRPSVKPALKPVAKPAIKTAQKTPYRTWTDSSGAHKVNGRFIRMEKREAVVIELTSGEQKVVPLSRLSNADIYEAVKADLIQGGMVETEKPKSPFE